MTTNTKEYEIKKAELQDTIKRLEAKRDEYEQRLDIGTAKIEEAINQGVNVDAWETYWIQLLRQYEAVIDKLWDCRNQDVLL
jgi:predicted DNA-binding protein YlxM (UPF0122 family)